jgi:cytoskeletal protein RodZ
MADDNYIDKLVGDSLEGYKVPYNEAHWEAMQQLMHRQQRRRIVVWWGSIAASLVVVIGAGLLWYSLAPQTGVQQGHITEANNSDSSLPANQTGEQVSDSEVEVTPNQTESPDNRVTPSKTGLANAIPDGRDAAKDGPIHSGASGTTLAEAQTPVGVKNRERIDPISHEAQQPSLAAAHAGVHSYSDFLLEPKTVQTIPTGIDLSRYYMAASPATEIAHRKRIWIEASGTATANVVSNVHAGYQAGLMAGMEVAPRIHTSAGAGFSQMQYNEAIAGDTLNGFIHIGTEGMFRFVELPLQVSVHNRVRPKLTTWISAALVNLFPVREQYTMEYAPTPGYPLGTANFQSNTYETTVIKDGSPRFTADSFITGSSPASESSFSSYNPRSWYGMGQVTAGLGYHVAPGMELTASASYRFPLQGIGLEGQKIHAPGIQLGLRYYLQ